ncbi:dTDP-4-dehydrorhamnose 3,5-epimerase [Gammaproteobacteria bacterium]|nr:dTDP-4-dehydrorhamnose 3,5-epimerase [Gammaproteobacteria bacterium]MDG2229731.1 dTDP-4-dehydrorhamnose 3,5-epimerase [Gammaproteobacteria bacterium]
MLEKTKTNIEGVVIFKPQVFHDHRGFFIETFSNKKYFSAGLTETFVQDNFSHSSRNTIRGLHYQKTKPQGKLVRVAQGIVFDVAVDIRVGSPTFGNYFSTILDDKAFNQLYMPPGIAHGFCVLSEFAVFEYKCTEYYYPEDEAGVLFNDPDIAIDWPVDDARLSEKDLSYPKLSDIAKKNLPDYHLLIKHQLK